MVADGLDLEACGLYPVHLLASNSKGEPRKITADASHDVDEHGRVRARLRQGFVSHDGIQFAGNYVTWPVEHCRWLS